MSEGQTTLRDLVEPFMQDSDCSSAMFAIDGVLAPRVDRAEDARIPDATLTRLRWLAEALRQVAFLTGGLASDARRLLPLKNTWAAGLHGGETLAPWSSIPELDARLAPWAPKARRFRRSLVLARTFGLRVEDKHVMVALHWCGHRWPWGAEQVARVLQVLSRAAGWRTRLEQQTLEVRPTVSISTRDGIVTLIEAAGALKNVLYVGDDLAAVDAFRGLDDLSGDGRLSYTLKIGVRSPETPPQLEAAADVMVDGLQGVIELLDLLAGG